MSRRWSTKRREDQTGWLRRRMPCWHRSFTDHGSNCPQSSQGQGQFLTRHPLPIRVCGLRQGCRAPHRGDNFKFCPVFDLFCRGERCKGCLSKLHTNSRGAAVQHKRFAFAEEPPRWTCLYPTPAPLETAVFAMGVGPTFEVTFSLLVQFLTILSRWT